MGILVLLDHFDISNAFSEAGDFEKGGRDKIYAYTQG
jgi:hypothetical protein